MTLSLRGDRHNCNHRNPDSYGPLPTVLVGDLVAEVQGVDPSGAGVVGGSYKEGHSGWENRLGHTPISDKLRVEEG